MANNRLWNILTFTNVAAGATVSLPHLLSNNGDAKVPDFGWVNNDVFVATADDTNVSVTNNSGAIATVYVLVCVIHSLIRVFGGTAFPDLSPKPYWIIGGGGGGTAPGTVVQRYTCTGLEGAAFDVVLDIPRATDLYSVFPALAGVTSIVGIDCPDVAAGDRTMTKFAVSLTGAVTAGDKLDFIIANR